MTEPTELTPEERISRGDDARQLLEHPLMKAFLENYREWSFKQFQNADISGSHEELAGHLVWLRMLDQAQQNFTEHFQRFVRDGTDASAELLQKRNPTTPIRSVQSYGNPRS